MTIIGRNKMLALETGVGKIYPTAGFGPPNIFLLPSMTPCPVCLPVMAPVTLLLEVPKLKAAGKYFCVPPKGCKRAAGLHTLPPAPSSHLPLARNWPVGTVKVVFVGIHNVCGDPLFLCSKDMERHACQQQPATLKGTGLLCMQAA